MITKDDIDDSEKRLMDYLSSKLYVSGIDLFLPYKEALYLRNKGFDEVCIKRWVSFKESAYLVDSVENYCCNSHIFQNIDNDCMAPTIDQANKWLKQFNSI